MSAFVCATCDNFRDADDGCDETSDGLRLICVECMADEDEDDFERLDGMLEDRERES